MTLRDFVRSKKTLVDTGTWSNKRMPKTGGKFPLSKARSFRVGAPGWRWRILQYDCAGRKYRILAMYHAEKENFLAVLATPINADLLVLGCLEYHSTHRGWHMHGACKNLSSENSGRLRYPAMVRIPSGTSVCRSMSFPSGDDSFLETVIRYFRLPPMPEPIAAQGSLVFPHQSKGNGII